MKDNSQLSTLNACASERNARSLAIFQRAQPSINVVNSQLDIINDYVTEGLLALDPDKPLAVIDWRLHLMYADDEAKLTRWPWRWLIRMGLIERDVRYRRLMKMVVLCIELMRGTLQSDYEARLILAGTPRDEAHAKALERYGVHTGPLHFIVTDPVDPSQPLLLGTYDGDRVGFAEASPNPLPKRGLTDIADDDDDDSSLAE